MVPAKLQRLAIDANNFIRQVLVDHPSVLAAAAVFVTANEDVVFAISGKRLDDVQRLSRQQLSLVTQAVDLLIKIRRHDNCSPNRLQLYAVCGTLGRKQIRQILNSLRIRLDRQAFVLLKRIRDSFQIMIGRDHRKQVLPCLGNPRVQRQQQGQHIRFQVLNRS